MLKHLPVRHPDCDTDLERQDQPGNGKHVHHEASLMPAL